MIRILLVDDHAMVRQGIRSLLEGHGGYQIVGEAGDGREVLHQLAAATPDLAIMDVAMPRLNGIETTRQIRAMSPITRVLMLSMHDDPQYVLEALRAGACGYVLKEGAFRELLAAIDAVMQGKVYLSQALHAMKVAEMRQGSGQGPPSALAGLTPRERQVLQLIAEGNSGTEIARELGISARTVESHRERIMAKLDLHSIADLTRFAVRHGVCSLN
jgi:DNA-binding NarL/FixJ family response regulator